MRLLTTMMAIVAMLSVACGDAPTPPADAGSDTLPPMPDYSHIDKKPCQHTTCSGLLRCRWEGRDEQRCQDCGGFGSSCPERCIAWCQRPCSVDAHCDEGMSCTHAYGEVYTCDE